MGIDAKKTDISSSASYSLNSLSFSGYLTSKDRQQHNWGAIKTADDKIIKTRDKGFDFGTTGVADHNHDHGRKVLVLPPPKAKGKEFQVGCKRGDDKDGERSFVVVRNNSIRRGGRRIREEEEEESSRSGWSVFLSFVSPCRECRATKPNVIQPPPIQTPSSLF